MRNSGSGRSPRAVPHEYQQLNSSRSLGADSPDFAVSFEDMVVHSRTGGERRRIVGHATGCVRSGQLLAIIGPPTQAEMFLHALRGVYPTPASGVAPGDGVQVTGTVSWNGQNPSEVDPRVLAFIDLSDGAASAVPPWCSAWDVLLVTIRVRVTFLSSSEQSAMVDQVLDMLQLSEVGATPFGELGPVQQRLVLLARAIVGCSGIVFIHNPIGGLEPADARVLLSSLKLFASAHGYAITVAIPGEVQAGCVALLPDVIVLASDGRVAYQGAADRAAHTLAKAGLARAPDHSSADLLVHGVARWPRRTWTRWWWPTRTGTRAALRAAPPSRCARARRGRCRRWWREARCRRRTAGICGGWWLSSRPRCTLSSRIPHGGGTWWCTPCSWWVSWRCSSRSLLGTLPRSYPNPEPHILNPAPKRPNPYPQTPNTKPELEPRNPETPKPRDSETPLP
ncbi:hypothetical protein T484DRAFT_1887009, partial [Baffinella frigidus]